MAVTEQTYKPDEFDMDAVEVDRGKIVDLNEVDECLDDQGCFNPHAITDDGVSPRALSGTTDGAHMSTGLEHDELGRRTEDTDERVRQVDKRNRKAETAQECEDWSLREFGDPDATRWWCRGRSNEGPILEAMEFLAEDGLDVRFPSIP